eukprot:TRINITY_DN239_c0_g1_i2.p2 TRINITY_DN239_c0_g1~~TRINITY_DN239_c0_g1_i2.p2  ORF type:complete len:183 (-),score=77.35 TRINITY_DN239_c0_g1_i2:62-610(-)
MALLFVAPASVGGLRATARGAAIGARPTTTVCRPRRSTVRAAATEDMPPKVASPPPRPAVVTPVASTPTVREVGVDNQAGALAEVPDFDADAVAARARKLAADVQDRPGYYASVAGYATGGFVLFVVTSAVVGALDRLPVIPSILQLIGLTYSGWFTYRYLLQEETREELKVIIEDLIGKTR